MQVKFNPERSKYISGLIQARNVWGRDGSRYFFGWVVVSWENLFVWVVVLWENILAWVVVLSVGEKNIDAGEF